MILLTSNAAIFHEFAGAFLQFYVINGDFAAISTHLILLFAVHYCNNYYQEHPLLLDSALSNSQVIMTPPELSTTAFNIQHSTFSIVLILLVEE
jgi:hypothetical protein